MSEKIYMSWDKFDKDVSEFMSYLKTHNFLESNSIILGLKRGGLPTAVALSNKLDIPISLVSFQTRDGDDITPNFLEAGMITADTKIIIPDDIYDSGLTIETVVKCLTTDFNIPIENIVGLFHYHSDKLYDSKLKFYRCMESNKDKWVVFCWE